LCVQKKIAEEEKAQRVALDLLALKQKGKKKMEEIIAENEDIIGMCLNN